LTGGPHTGEEDFATLVGEMFLPPDDCAIFTIYDGRGNEIGCQGGYNPFLDEKEISNGGSFDLFEQVNIIGDFACPEKTLAVR